MRKLSAGFLGLIVAVLLSFSAHAENAPAKTGTDVVLALSLKTSGRDRQAQVRTLELAPRLVLKFDKEGVIRVDYPDHSFVILKIHPVLNAKGDVKLRIGVTVGLGDGTRIARAVSVVTPMGQAATVEIDDERRGERFFLKVTPSAPHKGLTGSNGAVRSR